MEVAAAPAGPLTPETPARAGRWDGAEADWVLRLEGDWRAPRNGVPPPPPALQALQQGRVVVDAARLTAWDAHLASALWQRLDALGRRGIALDLQGLPPGLGRILALALPAAPAAAAPALRTPLVAASPSEPGPTPPPSALPAWRRWVGVLGAGAVRSGAELQTTLNFIGQTLVAGVRLLLGRGDMRLSDLAWQVEQTGPRSLPIIALVSFLVGLIVAYMGAAQLVRFGAQTYIADLVTVGVVREIASLLVGIVLAGRIGAAFAAQIGSMRANEEIDALQTLGIDPISHLVLPRVLALVIVGPLLTAFAAVVGMAVGWGVAVFIYGVTPLEYLYSSLQALTLPHVLIGLLKGTVYSVLVGLAGCRQGLAAGRSAEAVGDATTQAVVQAIVWIVVAASGLTVLFQRLDL